jgi:hypothetical protein
VRRLPLHPSGVTTPEKKPWYPQDRRLGWPRASVDIVEQKKRGEIKGDWRTPHNEDLHNTCSSPNIIRVIKSRGMRSAGSMSR